MEKIILVKPNLSYADEITKYKEESLKESPLINGSAGLNRFSSIEDWLKELKKRSSEDTVPEGLVPSSTYLGVREKDNYIVGMIDIRHYLNEYLTQVGGNIGYSVRKTERNKGYAKQMLKLALEKCKELKIKKDFGLIYNKKIKIAPIPVSAILLFLKIFPTINRRTHIIASNCSFKEVRFNITFSFSISKSF